MSVIRLFGSRVEFLLTFGETVFCLSVNMANGNTNPGKTKAMKSKHNGLKNVALTFLFLAMAKV